MTTARYTMDVYGVELHLATTESEWKRLSRRLHYLEKATPDSAGMTHFAVFTPNNGLQSIPVVTFWIRDQVRSDLPQLVETCAHEACHAMTHILTWAGHDIRGDEGNDEPSAYLAGWLTQWLWKHTAPRQGAK